MKKYSVSVWKRGKAGRYYCGISKAKVDKIYKDSINAIYFVDGTTVVKYKGKVYLDLFPQYKNRKDK